MAEIAAELEAKIDIILTKGIDNLDADFLKPPKTPMKTPKTPRVSKSSKYFLCFSTFSFLRGSW